MYLLYLDESGNADGPGDRHFVLAGAALFERTCFFLSHAFDQIQARHFPGLPPLDFHASPIRSGRDFWRTVTPEIRADVLRDIGIAIHTANNPGLVLFGAVVEKTDTLYGEDAVKRATAECCRRFDLFLARRHFDEDDTQRGLVIFAEGRFDQRAKVWVKNFRKLGTEWGILRNLSDIPYFASAKETRLLQLADYVAHALFLLYERRDPSLIGQPPFAPALRDLD